jgi:hypothetical protein
MSKMIVKHSNVHVAAAADPTPAPLPAPRSAPCVVAKRVTLVEQGGKPCAIELTCSCGETTLIELEYPQEMS